MIPDDSLPEGIKIADYVPEIFADFEIVIRSMEKTVFVRRLEITAGMCFAGEGNLKARKLIILRRALEAVEKDQE